MAVWWTSLRTHYAVKIQKIKRLCGSNLWPPSDNCEMSSIVLVRKKKIGGRRILEKEAVLTRAFSILQQQSSSCIPPCTSLSLVFLCSFTMRHSWHLLGMFTKRVFIKDRAICCLYPRSCLLAKTTVSCRDLGRGGGIHSVTTVKSFSFRF